MNPLEGILVVDLSQFLSGPSASLKLADLGARVIKVERPVVGDICRSLYVSNVKMNGESTVFHAINRNKESFAADLKNEDDKARVLKLIESADIVMHNFRPGVIDRLGLDYESISKLNPSIVYGEISGYGKEGPWKDKPGQDLLVQSLSGLTWLSGNKNDSPIPMGLAIVDILTGAHLVQGLLAALVRKGVSEKGAKVEVSMMESAIDFQFETITTFYMDGGQPTERTASNNAHAYLGAPYGIYKTKNGHLALAMGQIPILGELLGCERLKEYQQVSSWFKQRDEIKEVLAAHLVANTTEKWLSVLEPADIWCADVMDWKTLLKSEGYKVLEMEQEVQMSNGFRFKTTRCPIRIDGEILKSPKGTPILGEHTNAIVTELKL
ncbi:CaiB/BaiF CoA-transferase family protein [Tamlana sp. 2201CG12-4]|uniref:CaiB/BaiF CoA transferase family protein n=1 Tax=Tamlana sp. 2201CG12-4 TaxID=3112582 RepID=UPI002DB6B402|nr:CaiB/BaiF CoA-transferase family protein [Tamlana sp. 2201CG12-4]MEC3907852.1 CaiB/BaiF CoA-transferase family protein [Tamlana sp. 2201CG12-4]